LQLGLQIVICYVTLRSQQLLPNFLEKNLQVELRKIATYYVNVGCLVQYIGLMCVDLQRSANW